MDSDLEDPKPPESNHSLPSVEEIKANVSLDGGGGSRPSSTRSSTTQGNINRFNKHASDDDDETGGGGFGDDFDRTAASIGNSKLGGTKDGEEFYDQFKLPSIEDLKNNITTSGKTGGASHKKLSTLDDDDTDFYKNYAASAMLGTPPSPSSPARDLSESQPLAAADENIYGMHTTENKKKKGLFKFGCNLPTILCVAVLLLMGLVIGLSVGLSKKNKEEETQPVTSIDTDSGILIGDDDDGPSPTPPGGITATYSPTNGDGSQQENAPAVTAERYDKAYKYLSNMIPNPELLDNQDSSQAKALDWLSSEDNYITTKDIPVYTGSSGAGGGETKEAYEFITRYVLMTLYYSTRGDYWNSDLNFKSPNKHVCDWYISEDTDLIQHGDTNQFGVSCDTEQVIHEINIFSNNLDGKLPPDLALLTSLKVINLQDDYIYDKIPKEYYQKLSKLETFNLYSNELSGSIPTDVGNLIQLKLFDLSYNIMTGEIPDELGNKCTNLQILDISSNEFISGTIPESLKNLNKLGSLELNDNSIEQDEFPTFINEYNMPLLSDLRLSNNKISGTLPANLGTLSNTMLYLYLDGNNLSGPVNVLNYLTKLEVIIISDNLFTQTIEGSGDDDDTFFMKELKELTILDASNNLFMGNLPLHLLQMESLSVLDLSNNKLSNNQFDVIPQILEDNDQLEYLSLFNNDIDGEIPKSIANLQALTHLDLSANSFSLNDIPTEIGNLTSLTYLFLSENDFDTGEIPYTFQKLTKLKELSLSGTSRSGTIPQWIGSKLKDLVLLDLDNNAMDDTIPDEIGLLSDLRFLLLSRNNFTGPLPRTLANLDELQVLMIQDNDIDDNVDDFLCLSENPALRMGVLKHFLADCDRERPTFGFVCTCCTACCETEDIDCNSKRIVANLNGEFIDDYGRVDWDFGWNIAFNGSEIYDNTEDASEN